ncbi:hypothetical protein BHM03_00030378 [Ensete ventricosum]|nr:hypothetical protein BHM03_00030378 [Ensete ventricosum]
MPTIPNHIAHAGRYVSVRWTAHYWAVPSIGVVPPRYCPKHDGNGRFRLSSLAIGRYWLRPSCGEKEGEEDGEEARKKKEKEKE